MKKYNLFDVIGPIMVGPSSSHTAGAARIGSFIIVFSNRGICRNAGDRCRRSRVHSIDAGKLAEAVNYTVALAPPIIKIGSIFLKHRAAFSNIHDFLNVGIQHPAVQFSTGIPCLSGSPKFIKFGKQADDRIGFRRRIGRDIIFVMVYEKSGRLRRICSCWFSCRARIAYNRGT